MIFKIKLAEKIIEIHSIYEVVYRQCGNYLVDDMTPDIIIQSSEKDIKQEREIWIRKEHPGQKIYFRLGPAYLENFLIYRKIAEAMLDYKTFVMHGSVIATDGEAYMITAPSGGGKTTRTRMWLENIPGSFVVNGDKPLIKIENDRVYACGTPWCGKEGMNTNAVIPLRAILFLEWTDEDEKTSVREISFSEAFPFLYQRSYCPENIAEFRKTLGLLKQIKDNIKFYRFRSTLDSHSVIEAYNAVRH